nr:tail fiber domain-containing protein [Saprospiraceae bacterium]
PLSNAVQLIKALKPSSYLYKTNEYKQMELPEGRQFGLVADEVKQVFPSMVKQVVQPAKYENDDHSSGRVVAEEVSFEAVNYTAMIPVLIAAMQEQQAMIEAQQRKIEELEAKIK